MLILSLCLQRPKDNCDKGWRTEGRLQVWWPLSSATSAKGLLPRSDQNHDTKLSKLGSNSVQEPTKLSMNTRISQSTSIAGLRSMSNYNHTAIHHWPPQQQPQAPVSKCPSNCRATAGIWKKFWMQIEVPHSHGWLHLRSTRRLPNSQVSLRSIVHGEHHRRPRTQFNYWL